MNLAENLKRIRKENNLSQEQLAEKLGVSRQSVSKWESGTAYPEMDKVLQLAKLFNLNIDELLNQDIKEVSNEKQSKQAINKGIDDFLGFISKTIDMFSSLKFKDKIKCLFEQVLIMGVLALLFLIIGAIGSSILSNLLSFLPWEITSVIHSLFGSIYVICALVLGFILLIHIFKTRYLDYYVVIKEKEEVTEVKESAEEVIDVKISEEPKSKKIYLEKKKEKIVIRDPKHSEYKFISGMLKCLLFVVKGITLIIALAFCLSLIGFVLALVASFVITKTGLIFIGIFLTLLACIIINLIILVILFNFIMSKKSKKKLLLIAFLSSLLMFGVGAGLTVVGFTSFDYINDLENPVYLTDEIIIPMEEDLIIDDNLYCYSCNGINYVEENRNDIKISYKHAKHYELYQYKRDNYLYLDVYNKDDNFLEFTREVIKDINDKKIINYANYEITIYTSKENIAKIKNNQKEYFDYQNSQNAYTENLEKQVSDYQNRISELEEELEMYKNNVNDATFVE